MGDIFCGVKGLQSYANLSEGKVYCIWQAPEGEVIAAWFRKMNVPHDGIVQIELGGAAEPSARLNEPS